ncbi:MAG: hypothetical protein AM326_02985 [Candidatus Thorarchaeota archaeon SMTZ-45]|nr:MAG: hypothetical protein AM326_02985 [Candidatus Thorarchaeota archaeon SMTZ-45]
MTWTIKNIAETVTVALPQDPEVYKGQSAKVLKQHPMQQQYPFIFPHGGKARILKLEGAVHDNTKTIAQIYSAWLNQLETWAEDKVRIKLTCDSGKGHTSEEMYLAKFDHEPRKGFLHTVWIKMELWKKGAED